MEIKTIYKVRMWGRERGRETWKEVFNEERIIVNNLDTAKAVYEELKNTFEYSAQFAEFAGGVELFIPHIHENGELAYWPDNDEYIANKYKP